MSHAHLEEQMILGQHVCNAPNDKQQLEPTMASVSPEVGKVSAVLNDTGYYSHFGDNIGRSRSVRIVNLSWSK